MYECPNCAANLKFNIAKQMLYCEYCETTVDPYSFYKEKDAQESVISAEEAGAEVPVGENEKEYEVTIFTCPQCGGEILSEDTTAATFCSFCGSATILDSRISKERRPMHIIPFTKTKKDCEQAYADMMKTAFFAPKELKNKEHLEKFRGIYMPYWVYSFEKKGPVTFNGSTSRRRGDYIYTKHYDLSCEIDEQYKGLAYDASASFSDNLSGAIAPFDLRKGKPFVPSFLSGFYADTSDVDQYVYQNEAEDMIVDDGCKRITRQPGCRKYHLDDASNRSSVRNAVRPSKSRAELAMLPVWFLSYRNGDRVAYAVVNGQTGKAAADLPVDFKKYLFGSALLAIPLFILLNLFFTINPTKILLIAMLLAFICGIISNVQMSNIFARESGENDKGLRAYRKNNPTVGRNKEKDEALAAEMAKEREKIIKRMRKADEPAMRLLKRLAFPLLIIILVWMLPRLFLRILEMGLRFNGTINLVPIISIIFAVCTIIPMVLLPIVMIWKKTNRGMSGRGFFHNWKRKLPTLAKPFAGIGLALLILILNPVADEFYYIGAFVCMGCVLWAIMDIIKQHNLLTTRKLPQFNKRGGDENA